MVAPLTGSSWTPEATIETPATFVRSTTSSAPPPPPFAANGPPEPLIVPVPAVRSNSTRSTTPGVAEPTWK